VGAGGGPGQAGEGRKRTTMRCGRKSPRSPVDRSIDPPGEHARVYVPTRLGGVGGSVVDRRARYGTYVRWLGRTAPCPPFPVWSARAGGHRMQVDSIARGPGTETRQQRARSSTPPAAVSARGRRRTQPRLPWAREERAAATVKSPPPFHTDACV
jgi:hypothetical protein